MLLLLVALMLLIENINTFIFIFIGKGMIVLVLGLLFMDCQRVKLYDFLGLLIKLNFGSFIIIFSYSFLLMMIELIY